MNCKCLVFVLPLLLFNLTGMADAQQTKTINTPRASGHPIWDNETLKRYSGSFPIADLKLSGESRPPFYKGDWPLTYSALVYWTGVNHLKLRSDFQGFRNEFVFWGPLYESSTTAEGCRTTDSTGRLLAEAQLVKLILDDAGKLVGFLIQEYHYDAKGEVEFECLSEFRYDTGFKTKESDIKGQKHHEYYFLWPMENI